MAQNAIKISSLDFPEPLKNEFKKFPDLLVTAMKRDGLPIETGYINLGQIPRDVLITMIFARWIFRTNEVIDNLNLVLNDLKKLGNNMLIFEGEPHKRFYLLLRLYFYEFYRIREIFIYALKEMEREKILPKKSANSLGKILQREFHDAIKLRNNLVHNEVYWTGKGHFDICMVGGAKELGYGLYDLKKGGIISLQEILKKECDSHFNTLWIEGERMSGILQETINSFIQILEKPNTQVD